MTSEPRWEVLLLGPLVVRRDGRSVDLRGRTQVALFSLLALHRGEVVPVDRLIDDLWGSAAPPGAAKTLQVYVSRLRRSLGEDVIALEGAGYALRLEDVTYDVDRFELLFEQAQEERRRGDGTAAAAMLRSALALWRGAPLAELGGDPAFSPAIARMEELRLAALEERMDADLELGRHAAVVPELEQLVLQHPLRERLRGQLMLALYRSGRQADALEVYRQGRSSLREELGLEPGPELQELERAILNQEQELRSPRLVRRPPRLRRAGALALTGGLLLLGAAVAALLIALDSSHSARLTAVAPDSLAEIDPSSNSVVAELPIGSAPAAVTVGRASVWVANAGDQTLTRVDPVTGEVIERVGLGRIPSQIALGSGRLWIASAVGFRGVVQAVDPAEAAVVSTRTIRVGSGSGDDVFAPPTPSALATGGAVWVNNAHSGVSWFLPGRPGLATRTLPASHSVDGIAAGAGAVWVASGADDSVLRLDPRTGRVVTEIPIAAAAGARVASPYGIAVGFGSVWVTDALSDTVSRIDPKLNAVTATIEVGTRPSRIAVGEHAAWVVNGGDGTVTRIDPRRNTVTATIAVGRVLTSIAAGAGRVWVTVGGGVAAEAGRRARGPVRPLSQPGCSPLVRGTAAPTLLIASELPTFAGETTPDPTVAQMRAAILDVIRAHRFRAGRYRLAYQFCDDSKPEQGPVPERCASNARAGALNPNLIGVVGPYNSACAQVQLPILNAARGGPVPMVSPSNTYVGLTHAGPATAADEPSRYFPTGARSYVRLLGADDEQSAAIALFLKRRGRSAAFVLDDGQGTGFAGASYFTRAARRLGLPVVGRASWDPSSYDYRPLAQRIKRSGADAIVISGCVCSNGERLATDLRSVVGAGPIMVGTDNFTASGPDFPETFGPLGLYVTQAGRPFEQLPASGKRLLRGLAHDGAAEDVSPAAAYAGAATSILIDAIARSDGTRASVTRELLATRARRSLVGKLAFDGEGDPSPAPITVYRVDARQRKSRGGPFGLVFERTIEPSATLLR